MNNITLVGNLTADAEVRDAGNSKVISFNVANNSGFGEKKIATFFRVSLFRTKGAEAFAGHLTKGKAVFITGEFQARPYKSNAGEDKLSLDINARDVSFVGKKEEGQGAPTTAATPAQSAPQNAAPAQDVPEDDIPF